MSSGEDGTRIQALIARAGLASRRAAEECMRAGRVRLNGRVVTELGTKALPSDRLTLDGKPVVAEERIHHLALNKPPGYICAMRDDYGRPLAASLFKPAIAERVYNVGRLDLESCGLILFTNDGEFAARVGHPSSGVVKEYLVETDKPVPADFARRFVAGIEDDGETLRALEATVTGERRCSIRLVEGRNREIRRALKGFGLRATLLRRVAIGDVRLGDLAEGAWRSLSAKEVAGLMATMEGRR